MSNSLFAFGIAFFLFAYLLQTIHYVHMFQLNSYKPKVQVKWMAHQAGKMVAKAVPAILAIVVLALVENKVYAYTGAIALFFVSMCVNAPRSAKKPLVYTKRVKRMLATVTLAVLALILVPSLVTKDLTLTLIILSVGLIACPIILLICNYINQPLEKAINRHYINDARKILEEHSRLNIVGITGSYGKTSVKYILGTLLEAKYNVFITPGSFNTPLGITTVVRSSLRATHDTFVCEMGAKNVGDIKEICDFVHPKDGIITSVGPQHLESFKSLDNVKKTKFELADEVHKNGGKIYLNGEDKNIRDFNHYDNVIWYGLTPDCAYWADNIYADHEGTKFTVHAGDKEVEFTTSLIGKHNVVNILAAIAYCCENGIDIEKLQPYVRKVKAVAHRLEMSRKNNAIVIDDAYNSNPSGTKAALEAISLFDGFKVVITPGMVELGAIEFEENKKFGENIAKVCDYVVLVGKEHSKPIYEGLIEAGYDKKKIYITEDVVDGANHAYALETKGKEKVVLFENDLPDNY